MTSDSEVANTLEFVQFNDVIREQDIQLNNLSNTVGNLKNIGLDINSEIVNQNILLEGFTNQVDNTNNKFKQQIKNMNKLLKENGTQKHCLCILFLLLILLIIIFY